ncbi:MAG: hypothetical protein HY959_04515 [Ignavibacteriae bacterium]|nr:hypothetical protein [Ignavibacteriota bacterium]
MNAKIISLTFIFIGFLFLNTYGQLKKDDILLGVSGTYETDNKVAITSFNFEYEKFDFNTAILSLGASANYCNFTGESNKNFFFTLHANLNFNNVPGSKFIPFIGFSGGTNLALKDNLYGAHIGCRYFIEYNVLLFAKYGLTNRSLTSPEIGIDFRF